MNDTPNLQQFRQNLRMLDDRNPDIALIQLQQAFSGYLTDAEKPTAVEVFCDFVNGREI